MNDIKFLNVANWTKTHFLYYNYDAIPRILEASSLDFQSRLRFYDRFLNLFRTVTVTGICTVSVGKSYIEDCTNVDDPSLIRVAEARLDSFEPLPGMSNNVTS